MLSKVFEIQVGGTPLDPSYRLLKVYEEKVPPPLKILATPLLSPPFSPSNKKDQKCFYFH